MERRWMAAFWKPRRSPQPATDRCGLSSTPTAGQARGARLKRSLDQLSAAGTQWDIVETQARGDAEAIARKLAEAGEVGAITAAGGDGTINEAINGVMAAQRQGRRCWPAAARHRECAGGGIGHRHARNGGGGAAVGPNAQDRPRSVRNAAGTGRYFSMMAGVGFDAHVVAGIDPALKRRFGKGAYVWQTLKEWLALKPARYTLDGGQEATS